MLSDKLKKLISDNDEANQNPEEGKNNKKKIENIVFFVIVLIVTIIAINFIVSDNKKANDNSSNSTVNQKQLASANQTDLTNATSTSQDLKNELESILKKIQGVGEVNVFVNYSESSETVAMYNENKKDTQTEETDTSGGTRKIAENNSEKQVVYQEDNGEKIPITQKVINPKIEGAIITAQGANDVNVKANIIQAVEAVTGLATHKIQVFEMN